MGSEAVLQESPMFLRFFRRGGAVSGPPVPIWIRVWKINSESRRYQRIKSYLIDVENIPITCSFYYMTCLKFDKDTLY